MLLYPPASGSAITAAHMKGFITLILIAASVSAESAQAYPPTRKAEVFDEYHGVEVADPYRWLEDDNSPETKAWVESQNKVTQAFLERIPERERIRERLTKLWNYERFRVPFKRGERYFLSRNSGLQNQYVLHVADALTAEPRVLLDPNTLSPDGTVALSGTAISDDGNLLAYGISRAGSDWQEWRVRDVRTGADRDDLIEWVKFSDASWLKDGSGFYYSRYDAPKAGEERKGVNEFQKLYFHKLGTKQGEDVLVYERRDHKDWSFDGGVTDDGRYLIIGVSRGTDPKNAVFYQELAAASAEDRQTAGKSPVHELLPDFEADWSFIDNDGPVFFFSTDLEAPRSRVIAIDITKPHRANWREVIPQAEEPLKSVSLIGGQFICTYFKDARSVVRLFAWDGKTPRAKLVRELALPGLGSVHGFSGKRSDTETFYLFTSYTVPGTIFRLDLTSGESSVFREPKVDFDPAHFETRQVFYRSKDGTRVPMFLSHRRGLKLDGSNPTQLYGYGGFNVNLTPGFSVTDLVWMENGGVLAVPNLRGGGEYGSEWHEAGMKAHKQNVFDDFIAAAEWLIATKHTSPAKLAIAGGSNGGLLVGACMTQRPDLFGATLPSVGVMDMLRFHKFTIGWAWTTEYGSSDVAKEFRTLFAYSPLHQLRPGVRYPATLITTADHDDRVVPAHSFKFAARLQECQEPDGPPVLIRIETKAGHGAGTPLRKVIDERADELAFITHALSGK